MDPERYLIIGAAGRDFHNFNVLFRQGGPLAKHTVIAFTAAQIPNIDERKYPACLSGGEKYADGLPIWPEDDLEKIIKEHGITRCQLAYSDLPYKDVMLLAARSLGAGADFELAHPYKTMLQSSKPVVAVTAVRTGCGKSQVSRYVAGVLRELGKKVVVCRHPMPYGDLAKQEVQRFGTYDDLAAHNVTIEEREEYEQHIEEGTPVFAGVDYEAILRQAESEADVILWDGGNNDTPFFKPDLWLVVADPLRVGHESGYYPGDVNFRAAHVIIINKANSAEPGAIDKLRKAAAEHNPGAVVVVTDSEIEVDDQSLVEGKRVLLVDDGPTLTHGGMAFGASKVAADKYGAAEIVDPRPHFVKSFQVMFEKYPHLGKLIPAMGYWPEQIHDLEQTINAVPCDTVILGTPMDLRKLVDVRKPATNVTYGIRDRDPMEGPLLRDVLTERMGGLLGKKAGSGKEGEAGGEGEARGRET